MTENGVWADTFDGSIHCISINNLGHILAIGHGREVTILNQRTLCMSYRVCGYDLMTETDLAYWENARALPSPPEFTTGLPTPSLRVLHFLKDGHLVVSYMDHGIV